MSKVLFPVALLFFAIIFSACGAASDSNANANRTAEGNVAIDPNNMPPGLSASPVPPTGNATPGIPDPKNANAVPKGATPTPGIPDADTLRKPFKPGATPTPGIPSPEELRRQMQRSSNVNVNAPVPPGSAPNMMKGQRRPRPANRPE